MCDEGKRLILSFFSLARERRRKHVSKGSPSLARERDKGSKNL
jgi:hypothetical protein